MKQVVQAVKGTRDFYPKDMAFHNWLYQKVKSISQKFGYQEFSGPILEPLELYTNKTSEEILKEQIFTLKDRDNKTLVLRPELTPTFARMVAQKSGELPKQIRWFAFGPAFRYEQPQKGRGREFYQWEINLLGPEAPAADAEILAIAVEYFKALGLTSDEVVIRVNERQWLENSLREIGVKADQVQPIFRIIDRKDKISQDDFNKALKEENITTTQADKINQLLSTTDWTKSPWLKEVFESLENYGETIEYIKFDPTIVRGFDYYTKTVFEAWDKGGKYRAIFGGGRFDNLTAQVGGDRIPGVGMAPGDMMMQVILEEYHKMPEIQPFAPQVLVTVFDQSLFSRSQQAAYLLRQNNINTEIWLESDSKLDKQLKYADQKGISFALIIGPEEAQENLAVLKNLAERSQEVLTLPEVIQKLQPQNEV